MNHPLISVIITNYNYGKYITKSINSVLNQTYPNIELIIIDDGSTDDSDEVIKQAIKSLNDVIYVSQLNQGIVVTRNKGLSLISGDYFVFLDADDTIPNNYLEKFYYKAVETNADVIYGDYRQVSLNGETISQTDFPDFSLERILFDNLVNISAFAKKWIAEKHQFDLVLNHRSHEDWDFWLGVALDGATFVKCEDNYLNYLIHDKSRNQNIDLSYMKWQNLKETFLIIRNKYRQNYPEIFDKFAWLIQFSEMLYQLLSIQDEVEDYEEYHNHLRDQNITIYYDINGYSQEKSEVHKFNLTASELTFRIPNNASEVRIDLTEIFSLYNEVILLNEDGTVIESHATNGLQIDNHFYFFENDPQIYYKVKNYQGNQLTLQYQLMNFTDVFTEKSPFVILNHEINQLKDEVANFRQENVQILFEKKQLSSEYQLLNQKYQSIIYSRTWRLRTKIVQFIKQILRRIK